MDTDDRDGQGRDRDLGIEDTVGEAKQATEQEEGLGQKGSDTDQDSAGGRPR